MPVPDRGSDFRGVDGGCIDGIRLYIKKPFGSEWAGIGRSIHIGIVRRVVRHLVGEPSKEEDPELGGEGTRFPEGSHKVRRPFKTAYFE